VCDLEQRSPAGVFPYAVGHCEEHPGLDQSRFEAPELCLARPDRRILRLFGGEDLAAAVTAAENRGAVSARPTVYALTVNAERDERCEAGVWIPRYRVIGPLEDIDPGVQGTQLECRMTRGGFDANAACKVGRLSRSRAATLPVRERTEEHARIPGMGSELEGVLILGLLAGTGVAEDFGQEFLYRNSGAKLEELSGAAIRDVSKTRAPVRPKRSEVP